jgi:hypothetical protein
LALGDALLVNTPSSPNLSHYYCAAALSLNTSSTVISPVKRISAQLQQDNINLYRGFGTDWVSSE